jgi:hypothetical protein
MAGENSNETALESREPSAEDLAQLCGWLNAAGATKPRARMSFDAAPERLHQGIARRARPSSPVAHRGLVNGAPTQACVVFGPVAPPA